MITTEPSRPADSCRASDARGKLLGPWRTNDVPPNRTSQALYSPTTFEIRRPSPLHGTRHASFSR